MAAQQTTGKVVTVLGPVAPAALGLCLPHEHLVSALGSGLSGWPGAVPLELLSDEPVGPGNLASVRREPLAYRDNLRLDDLDQMAAELSLFAAAGGGALVDQTPDELGRDHPALVRLSRGSGLHVVAGCGHYVAEVLPERVAATRVSDLADELVADLRGAGRDGVPCGLIGEIGVSSGRIAPVELRVLQAVALAQRRTGAPVALHSMAPGHMGLEALLVLKEHGVTPAKVAVCHLDSPLDHGAPIDLDFCREIAGEGAMIELDGFGCDARAHAAPPAADLRRVEAAARLWAEGLGDRLLLSHDVAMKSQLSTHGGAGYAHLPRTMPPCFARRGIDAAALRRIMVDNPARWLAWEAPAEA
ncbi:MAG TPA: hypothetical protein VL117_15420 [Thermoleophilia bacterium]|nr:hypothetical protein [Thermoleophilia bacterium]